MLTRVLSANRVHTVCQEARCPNTNRCFKNKQATFLILGDICTRNCAFCAVKKSSGNILSCDWQEPQRIAQAVTNLGLEYAVITSVTRDDLPDGGAVFFARAVECLRKISPPPKIEVLIPDFSGRRESIETLIKAKPDVAGHNIETIPRLYPRVRPMADYRRSLAVLKNIKEADPGMITKSSLMLGMGEKEQEVVLCMRDIRKTGCDILTLGQYLAPSAGHYPVKEFIPPEQFEQYRTTGLSLGFSEVFSGPLVRSSLGKKYV